MSVLMKAKCFYCGDGGAVIATHVEGRWIFCCGKDACLNQHRNIVIRVIPCTTKQET